MSSTAAHNAKSAGQIENEVQETRANVSGTLDALRGKLQPSQIVDEVVERLSDYARGSGGAEFARNLGTSVRDNPLPVLLIGAGIGWLLLSKGVGTASSAPGPIANESSRGTIGKALAGVQDGVERAASSVGDAATRAVDFVKDAASGAVAAASGAAEVTSDVGDTTRRATEGDRSRANGATGTAAKPGEGLDTAFDAGSVLAKRAINGWNDLVEAQPLLLGVVGVALGAAVGAALPRTETEDRALGETRDALFERVSDAAVERYDDVRGAFSAQVERVEEAVSHSYERAKDEVDRGGISTAGSAVTAAAGEVSEAVGEALVDLARHVAPDNREPPHDHPEAVAKTPDIKD